MALAGQVTNPDRLEGRDVSFQSDGTAINSYLVRPRDSGSYPGIIGIHEAWGVIEHIRDVARRFASLGYIVLAPESLHPGRRAEDRRSDEYRAQQDARTARRATGARSRQGGRSPCCLAGITGKIGCVGFCMGGRTTLLYACSSNRLSAAIDCWGGGVTADAAPPSPERPTPIVDLVPRLSCPLYAVCGEEDVSPSPHRSRCCVSACSRPARLSRSTC